MKKAFSVFLAILLLISLIPTVSASEVVDSGKAGDNVYWKLYSDGTLIFSGTGAISDGDLHLIREWHSPYGEVKHVIYESGITHIGAASFNSRSAFRYLESVTIPSTVTSIGEYAFNEVPTLQAVYIDDLAAWCKVDFKNTTANPLSMHADLYLNGEMVTDLVIPNSIKSIPDCTFYGCRSIHTITIHAGVTSIGDYALNSCDCLEHVIFLGAAPSLGGSVFKLSDPCIYYPATEYSWQTLINTYDANYIAWIPYQGNLPELSDSSNCNVIRWDYDETTKTLSISGQGGTDDYIANSNQKLPPWDAYSKEIEHVVIGEGITRIGNNAFWDYREIKTVAFPDSLTHIGIQAFNQCYSLTEADLPPNLQFIDYNAFEETAITSVVIPESMTEISPCTFYNCGNLGSITLHDGITTIHSEAFAFCIPTEIQLPKNLQILGSYAFQGSSLTSIAIPEGVTVIDTAIFGSSQLINLDLHDGITEIRGGALRYSGSDALELPSELLILGNNAILFDVLDSIEIPRQLMQYGKKALSGVSEIKFTGRAPQFDAESFYNMTVTVYYPEGYSTWTDDVLQQYGGTVTWIPYETGESEPPAHVHTYNTIVTPPTCDSWGSTHYFCACGDSYQADETEPLGHEFGEWYVRRKPTEYTIGMEERICSICGYTETRDTPSYTNPFVDVKSSDYFYEPVMWALQNNITSGTSANKFSPNMTCTRGQVVTFLWRAAGEPEPVTTQNPFTDVKPSDYFYKAVLWAVENNITSGTGNGKFSPNMACSRAQVATFLWRANGEQEPLSAENPFTDVTASAYYNKAVLWAVENGITSGTGNGKFSPDMACSRGQIVTFLYRAYK